jgi:hypothetical protein
VPSTHALSHIHLNHWASGRTPMRAPASAHLHNSQSLPHSHRPNQPHLQVPQLPATAHPAHTRQPAPVNVPSLLLSWNQQQLAHVLLHSAPPSCVLPPLHTPHHRKRTPGPRPHAKETTHTPTPTAAAAAAPAAASQTAQHPGRRQPTPTASCLPHTAHTAHAA